MKNHPFRHPQAEGEAIRHWEPRKEQKQKAISFSVWIPACAGMTRRDGGRS